MLYLQCHNASANPKAFNRKMRLQLQPKKKSINSEIDYRSALDIFCSWDKFYDKNRDECLDRKDIGGELKKKD